MEVFTVNITEYSKPFPSGHMTFIQRRLNVDATLRRRCIDVMCLLGCDTLKNRPDYINIQAAADAILN